MKDMRIDLIAWAAKNSDTAPSEFEVRMKALHGEEASKRPPSRAEVWAMLGGVLDALAGRLGPGGAK